jgi:hypothetical protein
MFGRAHPETKAQSSETDVIGGQTLLAAAHPEDSTISHSSLLAPLEVHQLGCVPPEAIVGEVVADSYQAIPSSPPGW